MKTLCVFTLYSDKGASSKYRFFLYEDDLKKIFKVRVFPFWNDVYVKKYMHQKKKYAFNIFLLYIKAFFMRLIQLFFIATNADVVFFQKNCIPKSRINNIKMLKRKNIRIIFDVDDAIYAEKRDYSNRIAELSDVVICGNDTLEKHYKSYNTNVFVLPTVENVKFYRPFWKDTFENKTIGWIGSLTTIDNLDVVVNAINRVVEENPKVNVLIISNSALDYTSKIRNSRLVKWSQSSYISDLSSITIGIMPLKNNEINRGKCGFKLIQYLNLKKPVIASDVGVNKKIVGDCGYISTTEDEWFNAIKTLLADESEYKKKIEHIEKDFFDIYCYEKNVKSLIQIIGQGCI
jgi:glycosyltransferase involved in cell wall biosynthesis